MTAPDKIYIDRGPRGGWMHRHKRMPDTVAEYVRLDLNTRIVTVDQLKRWARVWHGKPADQWSAYQEIRAIIGEKK